MYLVKMCINNLKLDYHYRIGAEGKGNEQAQSPVPFFINGLAAVYSGLSQAILDEAVTHTTNRKYPDGKSLSDIETVQLQFGRNFLKIQRHLYYYLEMLLKALLKRKKMHFLI